MVRALKLKSNGRGPCDLPISTEVAVIGDPKLPVEGGDWMWSTETVEELEDKSRDHRIDKVLFPVSTSLASWGDW